VTPRLVQTWMQRWGQRAGVGACTPHRARHTFGTRLLEATGDLRLVQEALGHKTITSTQVYTRVSSPRLRAAVGGIQWTN
jgi:site-specific recombinase XerC